jgi:hypothetical protein
MENARLLLLVKLLHELQHRVTRLFLNLRVPLGSWKIQMHTPESVGYMMFHGRECGESGNTLEEVLFGGRLRHRHLVRGPPFVVSSLLHCVWYSRLCICDAAVLSQSSSFF